MTKVMVFFLLTPVYIFLTGCSDLGSFEAATTLPAEDDNTVTQSCEILNGSGIQSYIDDEWSDCSVETCNSGYGIQGNTCVLNENTRACSISNGSGSQTYANGNWGTCTLSSCSGGYHASGNTCVSNTRTCSISNGSGSQTYVNGNWGTCTRSACDGGYHASGNTCVSNTRSCSISNGSGSQTYVNGNWGACTRSACDGGYHASGNTCVSNTRTCSISNGSGSQTYVNGNWGTCTRSACDGGYHASGNTCVSNTRTCSINNGSGSQTYANGNWGTCIRSACDGGYHASGNTCVSNTRTCSIDNGSGSQTYANGNWGTCTRSACDGGYHASGNTCVSNTRSCFISNGSGSQTYAGGNWGTCTPSSCDNTYYKFQNLCVQNVTINAGQTMVISTNSQANNITVNGTLRCSKAINDNYTLRFKMMNVMGSGKFECGTASSPVLGRVNIILDQATGNTGRSMMAMNGGEISIHGDGKGTRWAPLSTNSLAGSNTIEFAQTKNWAVGDTLVVSSSTFNPWQVEKKVIQAVLNGGRKFSLTSSFTHNHHGELSYALPNGTVKSSGGASVGNLSRNIKIHADAVVDSKGGHIMAMVNSSVKIDSTELYNMGRQGELGRYPVHWHKTGNGTSQYLKNSSIYDSFQRCVVVHDTNNVLVNNNVCYNHFGHGFFLETGREQNNTFTNNLGVLSRPVPLAKALLISEANSSQNSFGRWKAPSTFWITHPNNIVRGNTAAGSLGSGFWMSFIRDPNQVEPGDAPLPQVPINSITPVDFFKNNRANSSYIGITWDGAEIEDPKGIVMPVNGKTKRLVSSHYSPRQNPNDPSSTQIRPVFKGLQAFKNREAGIYFRGDAALFEDSLVMDNKRSWFLAFSQEIKNSTIVGRSPNFSAYDGYVAANELVDNVLADNLLTGIVAYDGPFELNDVTFENFPTSQVIVNSKNITPIPIRDVGGQSRYINKTKGIVFKNPSNPYRKVKFENVYSDSFVWQDTAFTSAIRDIDGSLTGAAPNSILVSNHPFNNNSSCINGGNSFENTYICGAPSQYRVTNYQFSTYDNLTAARSNKSNSHSKVFFNTTNVAGTTITPTHTSGGEGKRFNKINTINSETYASVGSAYTLVPRSSPLTAVDLYIGRATFLDASHIVVTATTEGYTNFPAKIFISGKTNCTDVTDANPSTLTVASTINQFNSTAGNVMYQTGSGLYLKMTGTAKLDFHRMSTISNVWMHTRILNCN